MNIKVHRRVEVIIAETSSFNLLEDKELLEFFKNNKRGNDYIIFPGQNVFACMVISVSLLKKAINDFSWRQFDYRLHALKQDVAWAEEKNLPCVIYELIIIK